jgi:nucleotide-binding universal stress UspA family protein
MASDSASGTVVVGVDGSEASLEALREAQRLAEPLGADVEAIAAWEFPQMYDGYTVMGIDGFKERAGQILQESVDKALGPDNNVRTRLVRGAARQALIEASKGARMLVVGRRGHGRFGGLLIGSVSSACVAHAHCPVVVVHTPEPDKTN